jgi:hypothetical protein
MSSDPSVPESIRKAYANDWGYCGDEFNKTGHFPPQLYVREARRMIGDHVLTQGDVLNKTDIGHLSIGMGCYNFDSHCEERYACQVENCTLYSKRGYAAWQCGVDVPNPGLYQIPLSVILPKRRETTNLIVPVCSSASHVAYATVSLGWDREIMDTGKVCGKVSFGDELTQFDFFGRFEWSLSL